MTELRINSRLDSPWLLPTDSANSAKRLRTPEHRFRGITALASAGACQPARNFSNPQPLAELKMKTLILAALLGTSAIADAPAYADS